MKRAVYIKIVTVISLVLLAVQGYSIDYPHNDANSISCDSCHFVYGSETALMPEWTNHIQQDIDDTQFNTLCWSCHNDLDAHFVITHSSLTTSEKYLDADNDGQPGWTMECRTCHNPHKQQFRSHGDEAYVYQGTVGSVDGTTLTESGANWGIDEHQGYIVVPNIAENKYNYLIENNTADTLYVMGTIDLTRVSIGNTFGISYGKLIKDVISTPNSGDRTVRFFRPSGPDSFSDGDAVRDGICETCHTQTTHWRNDDVNTLPETEPDHNVGAVCKDCHVHIKGFKGSCDVCHGFPPVDATAGGPDGLVATPGPTNSITAGAHNKHVNIKGLPCENCHFDSVGTGPSHNNGDPQDVTIGFSLFDDILLGGTYNGQASVNYDTNEPNTTVNSSGSMTCENIYCHSNADPFDKTNIYRTPDWTDSLTCASCHDESGASTGLSGKHAKHTDTNTYHFVCEKCHFQTANGRDTIKDQTYHVNNTKDIIFEDGGTFNSGDKSCSSTYCHSDARGGAPNTAVEFDDAGTAGHAPCDLCHNGRPGQEILEISTNGHDRLVGSQWVRQFPCRYCHDATIDVSNNIEDYTLHVNGVKDIVIDPQWHIAGNPDPTYTEGSMTCENIYCHSDGTTVDPQVRLFAWDAGRTSCNTCHGHETGTCSAVDCHDDGRTEWPAGEEWKAAMPMYPNAGSGTERANSHVRHLLTDFTCDNCHFNTIANGSCESTGCHGAGQVPTGSMDEVNHINAAYHVNKVKDIAFKDGGTFDPVNKSCSNTACHTGADPQWGNSVNNLIICLSCHGTTQDDVDDFVYQNGTRAKINMTQWEDTGHGRPTAAGNYVSGNPPANFPGNPCWYCHDNQVIHGTDENPFRLKIHPQFEKRFEKECVFCHMEIKDEECFGCHNASFSLAPQLADLTSPPLSQDHAGYTDEQTSCVTACHADNASIHDTTGGYTWTSDKKEDVKNAYEMMGVCLQCHEDDSNGQCNQCHTGPQYQLGYDPGTGFRTASTAKATSVHFGYKHYVGYEDTVNTHLEDGTVSDTAVVTNELQDTSKSWTVDEWQDKYVMMTAGLNDGINRKILSNTADTLTLAEDFSSPVQSGETYYINDPVWKGGKFCWDCHDPHGDGNIFMVHDQVSVETDGTYGIPVNQRDVSFTRQISGLDYARSQAPFDGICNVCHSEGRQHYRFDYGDGHNAGRICTTCHEHRWTDNHGSGNACDTCHASRPVPRHTAFGLPRDCTKCHNGTIMGRMDIMGQFRSNSHHVQGVDVTNKHCYACHWEATDIGLINTDYHSGYNYKTHERESGREVDLVIWGPGTRPTDYNEGTTAVTFTPSLIGTVDERTEVSKVTQVCLGCHSDQNKETEPFGIVDPDNPDCKTPIQYAWDRTSISARYSQTETTTWGKYASSANAAKKDITKAFSAHGNAVANEGGWDISTGLDETIPNTRNGSENIQCYDCHSSHGSKASGITSSYETFNGTYNGANLKETQAGKGGYPMTYKPEANSDMQGVNPYNAGADLCFDCHENETSGTMPWGYNSTFGATEPILHYTDSSRFAGGVTGMKIRFPYRVSKVAVGGHLNASSPLTNTPMGTINGLCTPCHDPHGISPSLGDDQEYGVPMLKGTWLTSPYKEDLPNIVKGSSSNRNPVIYWQTDRRTFGNSRILEDDTQFAGLCLRCHEKDHLTDGINKNTLFRTRDRIHEAVKGWGNNAEHKWPCAKCHKPHVSGMPRLLRTNCLDYRHQGLRVSGGTYGQYGSKRYPRSYNTSWVCHESGDANGGSWTDQRWNNVTQW